MPQMVEMLHRIKHFAIQALRRSVQVLVVVLLAGMVYLSLYSHYRAAHAIDDEAALEGYRKTILLGIHDRVDKLEDPQEFLDDNKGTLWSMRLGGIDLTDPLAAAEAIAAAKTVYVPLLWSVLIPVVVTLLLGKVFCSWICPAGLLLEITGKLRGLLRLAELPPGEVKFSRANKYLLLVIGLVISAAAAAPLFALIYPPAAMGRLIHAWIFGTSLAGGLVLMGLIVAIEIVVSPRWWCRTMCPGGALYGLIGWPRLLRVRLDEDLCTKCRRCEPVCEPGLNPVVESYGIECDNCGKCVQVCPEKALRYSIGLPNLGAKQDQETDERDNSPAVSKATVSGILLAALLLCPGVAEAHHILGLPHYSYKENYPQVPVLEYPASTGPYDVLFVCYPGNPLPGEPANLVFDIKNRTTGLRYEDPVVVRVLQTFTFGANREILAATEVPAYDVLHKLSATFPEDGEYVVELTMDVEGQEEVIGFLMIAGNPSATWSVLITLGGSLAVFLITVRAIKKKRDRRKEAEAEE